MLRLKLGPMSNIAISSSPSAASDNVASPKKGLRIGLWVAQGLLAAVFLMSGFMKVATPIAELSQKISTPVVLGEGVTRFIGVSEILGAIGLILPAATRIKPVLTPVAAAALALVMVLATGFHVWQAEWSGLPVSALFGAIAAFVAWGRLRAAPIAAR